MALARNLRKKKFSFRLPKLSKKIWIFLIFLTLGIGAYGLINLIRLAPASTEKKELKFETGDRPLPQTISLWVNADGGLFMRETAEPKGKILIVIPNGTQLTAEETKENWFKVTYMNKTGWVNKTYVTTQAPAEDPTKAWNSFANKNFGYSLRYPKEWVAQDYGANPATGSESYVAFGPQLAPAMDPTQLAPVIVRVTAQPKEQAEAAFKSAQNSVAEPQTISGLAATKYTYNASSGVQMTALVLQKGTKTYIFEESGGYSDDLLKIIATITLG